MSRCACGDSVCDCAIEGVPPVKVTGTGQPSDPYLVSIEHAGEKDCKAITACVGENLGDMLTYDPATDKISVHYKGIIGCAGIGDCIGEHLGAGLTYDAANRKINADVASCPAIVDCVKAGLQKLINTTDPGGNALQIVNNTLLVKPADAGAPWDCEQTVTCIGTRLGDGLKIEGTSPNRKISVKDDATTGIYVTADGVGVRPAPAGGLVIKDGGMAVLADPVGGLKVTSLGVTVVPNPATGVKVDAAGVGLILDPDGGIVPGPNGLNVSCDYIKKCGGGGGGGAAHPGYGYIRTTGNPQKIPRVAGILTAAPTAALKVVFADNEETTGCTLTNNNELTLNQPGLWACSATIQWNWDSDKASYPTDRKPLYMQFVGSGQPVIAQEASYTKNEAWFGLHISGMVRVAAGSTVALSVRVWAATGLGIAADGNLTNATLQAVRVQPAPAAAPGDTEPLPPEDQQ